jgi:uncharacterized protein
MDVVSVVRCPAAGCGGRLRPELRAGISVDRCDRCSGLWFDARELDAWLREHNPSEPGSTEDALPRRGSGGRPCPRCRRSMETSGWTDLVLDRCPDCRGLFVEFHEMGTLEREPLPAVPESIESRLQRACITAGWSLLSAKALILLLLRFLR